MIRCTINDVIYRLSLNFETSEHVGNRSKSTVSVEVLRNQTIPIAGDVIRIFEDNDITYDDENVKDFYDQFTFLFLGTCGIPKSPKYKSIENDKRIYTISCRNANSILHGRLINYAASNTNLTAIINSWFTDYISQENITIGRIGNFNDVTVSTYVAPDKPLDEALDEIAALSDAVWHISEKLEFFFLKKSDLETFPMSITSSFAPFFDFQHKQNDIDRRTVQIITGVNQRTQAQTETFIYDGNASTFTVSFGIVEKPTITVNGTVLDPSRIGVNGLDNNDANIVFLFSFNSRIINYRTASGFLNTNDSIQVTFIGQFPVRIRATNDSAIEEIRNRTGFSGIIESVVNNVNFDSVDDANNLANSLLSNFNKERNEIIVNVTDAKLSKINIEDNGSLRPMSIADFPILKLFNFNLNEINVVGEFVITERYTSVLSGENNKRGLKCRLILKDRNFLRGYGEDLKNVNKEVKNLNVREDQIIIQNLNNLEDLILQEELLFVFPTSYYPVENNSTDLSMPMSLTGDFGGVFPI